MDVSVVTENAGRLAAGLVITLEVAVLGMAIALVLGLVVALGALSRHTGLQRVAAAWTGLLRGIPLLVFMYWVYYGLSSWLGLSLSSLTAAVLAVGLTGSAYMAEVYRAGITSVDPGQREAALAGGLSEGVAFRRIVLPQALRLMLPPTVNVFVGLIKGATIVSVIGVADMLFVSQQIALRTFLPFEVYTAAGAALVAVTAAVAGVAALLQRRLDKGRVRAA